MVNKEKADHSYTCPLCGKIYDIQPKWCPCTPYPMTTPEERYYLAQVGDDMPEDWISNQYSPLSEFHFEELMELSHGDYSACMEIIKRIEIPEMQTRFCLIRENFESFVETTDVYLKNVFFFPEKVYSELTRLCINPSGDKI